MTRVFYVAVSFGRFLSPEFIPPRQRTDPLKFFIERKDMIRRRKVLNIPEFYAGKRAIRTFYILIVTCLKAMRRWHLYTHDTII